MLPGVHELVSEMQDPTCSVLEFMVYSLGFEEAKVREVSCVYETYKHQHLRKSKVHKKMDVICAILVFTTKDIHFNEYCNNFDLKVRDVSIHLEKLRGNLCKKSRNDAIFEIMVSLCGIFAVQLSEIPELTTDMCNLQHSEKVVAGALLHKFANISIKNLCREMVISTTSVRECVKKISELM
jgi:predicted DNA-binding transcriptional regulator